MSDRSEPAENRPFERQVRPSLLTEKELLDIVDTLIRDRAFNRPAAVAIAMAVGSAVEAEVRDRCATLCETLPILGRSDVEAYGYSNAQKDCAAAIRGPNVL